MEVYSRMMALEKGRKFDSYVYDRAEGGNENKGKIIKVKEITHPWWTPKRPY